MGVARYPTLVYHQGIIGVGDNIVDEQMQQLLYTVATKLYGTTADLNFVTKMVGQTGHEEDIRRLLRSQMGLVQDPVSGTWMQLMAGPLRDKDLRPQEDDESPAEE